MPVSGFCSADVGSRCSKHCTAGLTADYSRFPLADVLWTLAMALDTYLVVFHHFDAHYLQRLEPKYIGGITALTFIPALVFLFIRSDEKGPVYGSETVGFQSQTVKRKKLTLIDLVLDISQVDHPTPHPILRPRMVCLAEQHCPSSPSNSYHILGSP